MAGRASGVKMVALEVEALADPNELTSRCIITVNDSASITCCEQTRNAADFNCCWEDLVSFCAVQYQGPGCLVVYDAQ